MKKLGIIGIVVILIATVGFIFWPKDEAENIAEDPIEVVEDVIDDEPEEVELSKVEIFADVTSTFGVKNTSTFTVKLSSEMDKETLKDKITIEPQVDFELEALDELSYTLTPKTALLSNTIYVFNYDEIDYGKAFQIADELKIYESFPGQNAYDVPTKTVIELKYNVKGVENIEDYFSIEPHVDGEFAYNEDSVVFMPEGLAVGTEYTVTIKKGMTVDDRTMNEDHVFSFRTGYGEGYWSHEYSIVNSKPSEVPVIAVRDWSDTGSYQVNIYQSDFDIFQEHFVTFSKTRSDIDFTNMNTVYEDEITSFEHNYSNFIELPHLAPGRYIVDIKGESMNQYVFLQVDPHQIYFSKMTNTNLIWIMNAETGDSEAGVNIYGDGELRGQTNEDGVYLNETAYDDYYVEVDGKSYLLNNQYAMPYYYYYDEYNSPNYWSFVYTDRSVYQPDDRIEVYGFVKDYKGQDVEDLHLVVKEYWGSESYIDLPITLESNEFNLGFDIEDFDYGYYQLQLLSGDRVVYDSEFSVFNYEKPEIRLESNIEESIVFANEPINYSLDAMYFNDMPYEGLTVTVSSGNSNNYYTTDENGHFDVVLEGSDADEYWYPNYFNVYSSNDSIESTYLSTNTSTLVVPRDVMILSDYELSDDKAVVSIKTNLIDLTNYNGSYGVDYENIKGDVIDREISVAIKETYYEKIFVETKYDPIHKVTYDLYNYVRREINHDPVVVNTVDGVGAFEFDTIKDHYYELVYSTTDTQNRMTKSTLSVGTYHYNYFDYNLPYQYAPNYDSYDIGDTVDVEILRYGDAFTNEKGTALHLYLRNGLLDYELGNEKLSFEFDESFRPNILLKSVYFDGENMIIVPEYDSMLIKYNYESLEGQITAEFDKKDYAPGDTVVLDLEIKRQNGSPFDGSVTLSIVDEAYFALYEDYFDLGRSLHAFVYNDGILLESVTAADEAMSMGGAEAGEGGDDSYIRQGFKDTALFETVEVKNGRLTHEFVLPDNLTSWRLTLLAVNPDLEYASLRTNTNVKLPFFVRALHNKLYLTGDEVYVALRADGDDFAEGDDLNYTAKLDSGDTVVESELSTNTKNISNMSIGVLDKGSHELTVTAQSEYGQDGIKDTLEVVDTILEFKHKEEHNADGFEITNPEELTTLYIYNEEARTYLNQVYDSVSYDQFRLEEVIARFGAYDLIESMYPDYTYNRMDVSRFQHYTGGLKPLMTSDPSIKTTALIAATEYGMSYFNRANILSYLRSQLELDVTYEDKAMVLWALAAQDEPVLLAVDAFLEQKDFEEYSKETQLYLLLALNAMGDHTRVFNYFETLLGDDFDVDEHFLFATLAYEMHQDVVQPNLSSDDTVALQKIYYMINQPKTYKDAEITLLVDGESTNYPLPDATSVTVTIPKNSTFDIEELKGDVLISEVFTVTGLEYREYENSKLSVEKSIPDYIKQGDTVKVILNYNKPSKYSAVIYDTIPAGFEFAGFEHDVDYYGGFANQYLMFYTDWEDGSGQVSYYIKAVQKGVYHNDPSIIQNFYDNELYMTQPSVFEVE